MRTTRGRHRDAHGCALCLLILAGVARVVLSTLDAAVYACAVCARRSFGFGGKVWRFLLEDMDSRLIWVRSTAAEATSSDWASRPHG